MCCMVLISACAFRQYVRFCRRKQRSWCSANISLKSQCLVSSHPWSQWYILMFMSFECLKCNDCSALYSLTVKGLLVWMHFHQCHQKIWSCSLCSCRQQRVNKWHLCTSVVQASGAWEIKPTVSTDHLTLFRQQLVKNEAGIFTHVPSGNYIVTFASVHSWTSELFDSTLQSNNTYYSFSFIRFVQIQVCQLQTDQQHVSPQQGGLHARLQWRLQQCLHDILC